MKPPLRSTRKKPTIEEDDPDGSSKPKKKAAPKKRKAPQQDVEQEDEESDDDVDPPEAGIPRGATEIPLTNRDPQSPRLFLLKSHPKAQSLSSRDAKIILIYCDWRKKAMTDLFQYAATLTPPKGEADAVKQGFFILEPSRDDRVLLRHKFGSGLPQDDRPVSWALARHEFKDPRRVQMFEALRKQILGDRRIMTEEKAVRNKKDGSYFGGVDFERNLRARGLGNGPRCYPLSITIQVPKSLSAPGAQAKVFHITKDFDAQMRFDLLKYGSASAMEGLWKGGMHLKGLMMTQAEFTNLPRVGSDANVAYPAFQLNIASAMEPSKSAVSKIGNLGKFGSSHGDYGDSGAIPTAMTTLSQHYDGIESEIFFIMDFGLGWRMDEFATLFFSGLYFHGGCQPTYKPNRKDKNHIHYRLTLIAYPPNELIEGKDALAFATLPNKNVLPIGLELRNPSTSHLLHTRPQSTQATYTGDGSALFEPISGMRHFTGSLVELVAFLIKQLDPCLLARFDVDRLISAFSYVDNGVRVTAPPRALLPGWRGEDVRENKDYTSLLLDRFKVSSIQELASKLPEELAKLHNTDNPNSLLPYDNPSYQVALTQWNNHMGALIPTFPVHAATNVENHFGGRLGSKAKAAVNSSRKAKSSAKGKKPKKGKKGKQGLAEERVQPDEEPPAKRRRISLGPVFVREEKSNEAIVVDTQSDMESEEHLEGAGSQMMAGSSDVPSHPTEARLRYRLNFANTFELDFLLAYEAQLSSSLEMDVDNGGHLGTTWSALLSLRTKPLCLESRKFSATIKGHFLRLQGLTHRVKHQTVVLDVLLADCLDRMVRESWPFTENMTSSSTASGLSLLIRKVSSSLADRPGTHVLDAADYLDGFQESDAQHTISHSFRRFTTVTASEVYTRVVLILCEWLDLPDPSKVFPRAWFASEILRHVGVEGLYLEAVQYGVDHLNEEVLRIGKNKKVDRDMVRGWFADNLQGHPITMPDSEERRCLRRIAQMSPCADPSVDMDLSHLPFLHASPLSEPFPSVDMLSSILPPKVSSPVGCTTSCDANQIQRLLRMVTSLYPLIEDLEAKSTATDTHLRRLHDAFLQHVVSFCDQRLPFRNLAPSRRKITESSGPYSPQHRSTVAGFFSALLFRGITHSTQFLQDHPISVFSTLQKFVGECEGIKGKGSSYFCNTAAYGRPHGRTIENAPAYWKAAILDENNKWITSAEPFNFLDVYGRVKKAKLPCFGALTTSQLVIDYAECGRVTYPTLDEMALLILKLQKGALDALRILGFQVGNVQEVGQALRYLQAKLEAHIPEETRRKIDFGFIFMEHLLCKFKKLEGCKAFKEYDGYLFSHPYAK